MTTLLPEVLSSALAELARVPRLLVALDFDGTLAPEVDVPEDARAIPEARDALLRLNALDATRVALVSGRALDSLIHVSQPPGEVLLIGSHGVELRLDDPDDRLALTPAERERVETLRRVLTRVADGIDEVWVESKPAGFALHTRLASEENARLAQLLARRETASELGELTVREGKNVLEFSLRSATKGEAIERLRRYTSADAVLFAGDDVTDEDGFAALQPHDVGIKVGAGETAATFRVSGPAELSHALRHLATARAMALDERG